MSVEVRQARYFTAVAEELHFGRAAERLTMSQPPLSQAILQLERQLGATLLNRSSRSVTLTETGRLFLDECRALIAASERAKDVAMRTQAGLKGTLRIGAVTSAFTEILPGAFERFSRTHPDVEVRASEIDTHHGQDALLRGELDLAVIRQSVTGQQFRATPLRRDHFVVALPPRHRYAALDAPVALEEFQHDPWVWLVRQISPDYHDEMTTACRKAGFSPEVRHLANSIHSQLAMVACGLGVTIVPESSARAQPVGVVWRELQEQINLVELSIVSCADRSEPLVDHFMRCILEPF